MPQSVDELKTRAEQAELSDVSTDQSVCGNCRFYAEMVEGIGYCSHRAVDMVVGEPWWCKFWAAKD